MLRNLYHPETKARLFSIEELESKDGSGGKLADGFADKLVELRVKFNAPLEVTSCCRSMSHNRAIGGNPRSFHLFDSPIRHFTTCAIDVKRRAPQKTRLLIQTALNLGWSAGVARTFIHLDRRVDYTSLPQTFFTY